MQQRVKIWIIGMMFLITIGIVSANIYTEYKSDVKADKCKDKTKEVIKNYDEVKDKVKVCEYTDSTGKTWIVIGAI